MHSGQMNICLRCANDLSVTASHNREIPEINANWLTGRFILSIRVYKSNL